MSPVLVSVEQYEALQEAAERQHAVAAALASVRAEGLEPSAEDLVLFAEVAAGGCPPMSCGSGSCPATAGEQRSR